MFVDIQIKDDAKEITEKDKEIIESWYNGEFEGSIDEFITKLLSEYKHDYGTICHAIAAAAYQAAWSVCRNDAQGGITGFQAQCAFWEFASKWMMIEGPAKLLDYRNLLYPQYEDHFDKAITQSTLNWLVEKAKELKSTTDPSQVSPNVLVHWDRIIAGDLPFGYRVKTEH